MTSLDESGSGTLLEVIVSSVEDARAAWDGGAHRAEVVSRLEEDGLTPTRVLVETMLATVSLPLRVMVRPSNVFTVTDPAERAAIVADAAQWAGLPIDGVVTGYVTADGAVDEDLLRDVVEASGHRVTFHRAIERVTTGDAIAALRRQPRVDRILSGGGDGSWHDRTARLEALQIAASPMVLISGGGVDAEAVDLLAASPVLRELHVGRTVRVGRRVEGAVEAEAVRTMLARIARAGSVRPRTAPSAPRSR